MLVRIFDDEVGEPALRVMQRTQDQRRIEQRVCQIAETRISGVVRRVGAARPGVHCAVRRDLLSAVQGVGAQLGEGFQLPAHRRRQIAYRLRPADL